MRAINVCLPATLLLFGAHARAAAPVSPLAIQNAFNLGVIATAMAFDGAGNLYLAGDALGLTGVANLTVLGPLGGSDLFVAKISLSNQQVLYVTEIGGSNGETLGGMAVDADGNVFLAGETLSPDFPTTPDSFQPVSTALGNANAIAGGGFLLKLDPSGRKLAYSTYIDEPPTFAASVVIDRAGNAYVAGSTDGRTFPTTEGAFQGNRHALPETEISIGFVSEFDASGKTLLLSTLFGSFSDGTRDEVRSIAVDSSGVIHICGQAFNAAGTPDFPTTPRAPYSDAIQYSSFFARLNPSASVLLYSTMLPIYYAASVGVDSVGNSYVAGIGLAKIDVSGSIAYLRTDLGGTLIVLEDGTVEIAGATAQPNFPTRDTLMPCDPVPQEQPPGTLPRNVAKVTFTVLDPDGNITFSTLLGNVGQNFFLGMALDPSGAPYLAGFTSTFKPTFPGGPTLINGSTGFEMYVFQLDLNAAPRGLPAPSCLVNGASLTNSPVAPEMFAILYGSNLGPSAGVQFQLDASGQVPTELAGTTVTVGGVAAPVIYVQDSQVNFVVPQQVTDTTTAVCVTRAFAQSCVPAYVAQTAPGVFGVVNQDGTLNTPQNPAPLGSIITLFGTGMGPYDRGFVDGSVVGPPLASLKSPVQAVFSSPNPTFCYPAIPGLPCTPPPPPTFPGTVLFAGAATQQVVGVTQINIEVPDDAVVGTAVPLGLQSALFNFSLTVAIK